MPEGPFCQIRAHIFSCRGHKEYIAWKALGRDCTNNNGLILQIGVLSSQIINAGLCHTVFAGIRYLGMYIYALYTNIDS